MALSDAKVKNLKPKDKPFKAFDERGLFLMVTPAGGKLWRFKYRFGGKEKTLAFGKYPDVSLKSAREKRDKARSLLGEGKDPAVAKRQEQISSTKYFEVVAREWWKANREKWSKGHADLIWRRLEKNIFPWIGHRPVSEITARELLETLRRIEKRGALETARRINQVCGQVFLYAIGYGYCENNPANGLTAVLKRRKPRNFAAITDVAKVRTLLRDIDAFEGSFIVSCALKLAPLVFVRPGELRKAEWKEIDLDAALWTIPGEKMKMKRPHVVPLSKQAVEILKSLYPLTGHGKYVFPSIRTEQRPMSENTLNVALRRLGYTKDEMTAHGFRTMASTLLHEMGWRSEVIEAQLAHRDRNRVRGIYNKAQYLKERRKMMQTWADYLDNLKAGAEIIPFEQRA